MSAAPAEPFGQVYPMGATWGNVPVSEEHAELLAASAITPAVALAAGVCTINDRSELPEQFRSWTVELTPAIGFPWRRVDGSTVVQVRPDEPVLIHDEPAKYVFAKGEHVQLGVVRRGLKPAKKALIVEGTKQSLAAASHAPAEFDVYAVAGCYGWKKDGLATTDLHVFDGVEVYVAFDADVATNKTVHTAAKELTEALEHEGATGVRWVKTPGSGKHGLDDVLARQTDDRRPLLLERLLDKAGKLPRLERGAAASGGSGGSSGDGSGTSAGADPSGYFAPGAGLLVKKLADDVRAMFPAALTSEQRVAVYQNGVYDIDGLALKSAVTELLGDRYTKTSEANVESYIIGRLAAEGAWLPDRTTAPLVNVQNGMLDLVTGELHEHHPSFFSAQQLPIVWDADAKCPAYEQWVEDIGIVDQIDDLEEVCSTMLDPSMTPPKAVFLFGPSRSGKSTYLRLLQAVAGSKYVSAVTLHELVTDKHMSANVYGKVLNCAADLSARHIQDLSIFKMMTGEDPIQANRKWGAQFAFVNRALFAFSANEIPTVGESSAAYMERVKPFEFARSFAGREDPQIENRMLGELPGIVARWVRAYQRRNQRGLWLPTDADVRQRFEAGSDRVRQWVQERAVVTTEVDGRPVTQGSTVPAKLTMTHREIVDAFNRWAEEEHGHSMTGKAIKGKLLSIPGVFEVRRSGNKAWAINVSPRPEGDRGGEDRPPAVAVSVGKTATGTATEPPAVVKTATGGGSGGGFSSKTATASAQVTAPQTPKVAEVAVSEASSLLACSTSSPDDVLFPQGGQEFAGTATSATEPSEGVQLPVSLPATTVLPEGVLAIDIETGSSERLWDDGPEFVRLVGYQVGGTITVTTDVADLIRRIKESRLVIGHNIMGFDLLALARHHGLDMAELAAQDRVFDTMLASIVSDPPKAEGGDEKIAIGKIMRERSLDRLGEAILGATKTGDLKGLAKEFGGFDAIPVTDARFVEYLRGDVDLTAQLAPTMRMTPDRRAYLNREHRVAAIAGQIRMNGFRVDVDLARQRHQTGLDRGKELVAELTERYPLPLVKADGKPVKSPQNTKEGKATLVEAFEALGVELPRSAKTGEPGMGADVLNGILVDYADNPEVVWLAERVKALNGIRTVYGTALEHLHGDRVHCDIRPFQASGRWSTVDPGLTVFGKRDGRHVEREIFLPEPGHVIIAADLSQVDARALAALSQDEAYLAMFAPGLDLHSEVAIRAFGLEPPEDIRRDVAKLKKWLKPQRDQAKVIGHGWNYGRGVKALAGQLGGDAHAFEVATEFDRRMSEQFPRLVQWRMEVRAAGERGELLDNGFGRLMAVQPDRAWTQAPALMGQGCARDLMMNGLLRLPDYCLPYLRAVVHDEVVLSVPEDNVERIERDVVEALSFDWKPSWGEHSVHIEAGLSEGGIDNTGRGRNWGHIYEEQK